MNSDKHSVKLTNANKAVADVLNGPFKFINRTCNTKSVGECVLDSQTLSLAKGADNYIIDTANINDNDKCTEE